jgi:hypothetical protein
VADTYVLTHIVYIEQESLEQQKVEQICVICISGMDGLIVNIEHTP